MSGSSEHPQNTQERFEAELLAADRQFASDIAAASPGDRAAVWASWFEDEGVQVITGQIIQGQTSITALMAPAFTTPGFMLAWDPDLARSAVDGTLGLTSGRFESRSLAEGQDVINHGRYVTVWKKVEGQWRVTLDTGTPD